MNLVVHVTESSIEDAQYYHLFVSIRTRLPDYIPAIIHARRRNPTIILPHEGIDSIM